MSISISGNGTFTGANSDYSFDQSVSIGGTLTYEDVTNIDSVGVITARGGLNVGPLAGIAATISANGRIFTNATDFPYSVQGALVSGARAFYVKNTNNSSGANYHFYGNNADGASFTVTTAGQGYFKGDVGIKTLTSSRPLTNAGAITLTSGATAPQFRLNQHTSDTDDDDRAIFGLATAPAHFFDSAASGDTCLRTTSAGNLLFGVGQNERMRLDSSGKLLVANTVSRGPGQLQSNPDSPSTHTFLFVQGHGTATSGNFHCGGKKSTRGDSEIDIPLINSIDIGTNINVLCTVTLMATQATTGNAGTIELSAGFHRVTGGGGNFTFYTNTPVRTYVSGSTQINAGSLAWVQTGNINERQLRYTTSCGSYTGFHTMDLKVVGHDYCPITIA